jgi:muramoyltetrapeptide carboxypeptidase
MRIIKPKCLRHADVIGICAPGSPPASEDKLNKGICYLEHLGFRVELGKNIYRRRGYLAGTDTQRAADINQLFANSRVKAIFTVRGGYGSHRILPFLDYSLIKHNPKILVGYSDITALHFAVLTKSGIVSFSGPMVASEMSEGLRGEVEERFWNMLMSPNPPNAIKGKSKPLSILDGKGVATGRLLGGNLSLISALIGTPFFPSLNDPIFILEEIDERPYRIDRMLQQIKLSGIFNNTKGIALGDFSGCDSEKKKTSLSLQEVFKDAFQHHQFPIISNLPFGHLKNSLSFPIGVRAKIDGRINCLEFLEAGVSK